MRRRQGERKDICLQVITACCSKIDLTKSVHKSVKERNYVWKNILTPSLPFSLSLALLSKAKVSCTLSNKHFHFISSQHPKMGEREESYLTPSWKYLEKKKKKRQTLTLSYLPLFNTVFLSHPLPFNSLWCNENWSVRPSEGARSIRLRLYFRRQCIGLTHQMCVDPKS